MSFYASNAGVNSTCAYRQVGRSAAVSAPINTIGISALATLPPQHRQSLPPLPAEDRQAGAQGQQRQRGGFGHRER